MWELYLNKPHDMELRKVERQPPLKDDEVKIRLIYGGICGSDLRVFKGSLKHASYPIRAGHEVLGRIVEIGKDVKYEIGTRVVLLPNTFCGECDLCSAGKTNICRHKKSLGINTDGGFTEELIVPSKYVLPIPDDVPDKKAVLIEPFAVIVHAFKKVNITKDRSVAIVGCGNEGMLAAALAHYLGAHVTALDINPAKLEMVRNLGDIRTAHPNDINGETFDIVIEAAGTKQSVEQGFQLVNPGGEMVLIGMTQEASFPVTHFVRNELTLYGSIIYRYPSDFLQSMEYLRDHRFHVDHVISGIVPFTRFQEAYALALSGDHGKILLDFKGGCDG